MQRPRRTTEFETPSTAARQSRPSRLQQPAKRPSARDGSLTRSSSVEPLHLLPTGTGNHLAVPTSGKRQRSSSVSNARTPQRTPTRITPLKVSQLTNEKQRATQVNDKRWVQEQVVKITEYLKSVDCGIPTDFLNRGGLKSMSTKQFIGLVNYFLKFVAGNKFTVGANHVESISKILDQIDYPYTVNKSWLKTPTVPHAFGNAVILLSFFMEFIPPADNVKAFKKSYLIISEEFPDMEFAVKLSDMAEEGFDLWNNQKKEEFEKLQKAALENLIFKKVSIPSLDAFDEEIKCLNAKLDKTVIAKAVVQDEEEYNLLKKELKTNQRKIAKLHKARQENQKNINSLESKVNSQEEQIAKLEIFIEKIRNVVATQEVSIEERNKLIEEVSQLQYILKTKKQSVCDLQEMDNQSQVLLSRHIKQLTEKIAKFNSSTRQIKLDPEDLHVDIESLCLHQNSEISLHDQIVEIKDALRKLQKYLASRKEELSKQNEFWETQIKLISYEISEWIEPKTQEVMQSIKEKQRLIDELDREIIAVKNSTTNRMNELSQMVKQSAASIDSLKESIEKAKEEILEIGEENKAMMALVSEGFDNFFAEKDARLKKFQEALQHFQKKLSEVKSTLKLDW